MPDVPRTELLLLQKSAFPGFYFCSYPERDPTEMFLVMKRLVWRELCSRERSESRRSRG